MYKKYIVIISTILIISTTLIAIIINKNSKDYINLDGVMLALTLDGKTIKAYPEGTNYGIEINCENGTGKWLVDEWKLAVEEITGNVICNLDFTSRPQNLKNKVEEVNVNNNSHGNGYRYSGQKPNNYIWFNNEMWRVIGSIPTCLSASCGTNTTNLVKIIRKETIGGLAYHAGNASEWGNNTLFTLLNNYYYGKLDGTNTNYCYGYSTSAKAKCDYTNIGIDSNDYYGRMIKKVYWNSGNCDVQSQTPSTLYTREITTRTVSGYIGIMSASDYGYAVDSSYHNSYVMSSGLTKTKLNWLYGQGTEWLSQAYRGGTTSALYVSDDGSVNADRVHTGRSVRPVVYLDSSVYIVSGDGTEANPYQIGM